MIAMFAFVLCTGMFSCKDKAAPAGGDADSTKVEAGAPAQEEAPDLAAIIEKVKAEGANWDEDQWKDCLKQAMLAAKPMMVEMAGIMEQIEKDPTKAEELMAKAAELETKYADLTKQMEELDQLFDANPIAKKLNEDEEFTKKLQEELGIPDID